MVKLLTTKHVRAMTKAIESSRLFKIEKDRETVRATTRDGKEVFAAIKKGSADAWIVRHHNKLFD